MSTPGLLISFDGPGGAGKSTFISHLVTRLTAAGLPAYLTAQPSAGPIGSFARTLVATSSGPIMACLFAADRYHHLDTDIRPHLADGNIVICDRYTASGMVVQRADGLDIDFLANINRLADLPDLAIILSADPHTIEQRVTIRGAHNRYQGNARQAAAENDRYLEAADYLTTAGVTVLRIDTSNSNPEDIAATLATRIETIWRAKKPAAA